jgi:hypothetical protein
MSQLAVYERHSVHDRLSATIQTVSEARLMDSVPEQDEMQLDRIHYVLSMLQTILNKADPYLLPISILDTAQANLDNILSYAQEYKRSRTPGQLSAALNNIDAICNLLRSIYIPIGPEEFETVKDSAISLRQSLSQHMRYAHKESAEQSEAVDRLKAEIEELKRRIGTEQGRVDGIAAEFQRQFTQNEGNRQEVFKDLEQSRQDDFDGLFTALESKVSDFMTHLQQSADETSTKMLANDEEKLLKIENLQMALISQGDDIVKKLVEYQEQGKSILGNMSINSHAAGYKMEADKARRTKNLFYWLTGFSFIGLISSALWNSLHVPAEVNWTTIASKWVATLAISAAVTYFARQAAKHDINERDNRYMQLQLATIDPYLEIFEETERKEVKKALVDRIFTGVRKGKDAEEKAAGLPTEDFVKIIQALRK